MRPISIKFQVLLTIVGFPLMLSAQFADVTNSIGEYYTTSGSTFGSGQSFYDFNQDGWDDLSIGRGTDSPVFLINDAGTFIPANFTIPTPASQVLMLLWADYDNDGDQDILITKFDGTVELWNNDGAFNFTNVAGFAGLVTGTFDHCGAAFVDYDHDGFLDLYITKYYSSLFHPIENHTNILYHNNGDGTFTDVTEAAGVFVEPSITFQPVFFDYNRDGWEDLYLINELTQHTNNLFENNGDGTFTEVSDASGAGVDIEAMSGTVGDFDNDLDLDILVTNRPGPGGLNFLVNEDGFYTNQAESFGFGTDYSCWGATWLDYNNDGWQDAFVAIPDNGQPLPGNEFFVNDQGTYFHNGRDSLGFGDDFSKTYVVARGDFNNDGYYDLVHGSNQQTPVKLFRNGGGTNHYLSVSLEGTLANRDGIGSWIYCYTPSGATTHFTMCGENLIGQNSKKQIFGLGTETTIDSLVIDWNSGTHEVYPNPEIDQHLHLVEGASFSQPFTPDYTGDLFLCPGESIALDAGQFESYLWSTGDTTQTIVVSEPGTYIVEVINAFGFTITSIPVVVETAPDTELITLSSDISCAGEEDGAILVEIEGSSIDSILWNDGQTTSFIGGLDQGVYSFSGFDGFGCPFSGEAAIDEPAPLIGQATSLDAFCYGEATGSVEIELVGGTPPYNAVWGQLDSSALEAGEYSVTVSDANACEIVVPFVVEEPDSIWIEVAVEPASDGQGNGAAEAFISGGTPPFEIIWSNGATNTTSVSELSPGAYTVTVTDANGCTQSQSFTVSTNTGLAHAEASKPLIYPNPNRGGFYIANCPSGTLHLSLFDMTGRKVLSRPAVNCREWIVVEGIKPGHYVVALEGSGSFIRLPILLQ